MEKVRLSSLIGGELEEDFLNFDLTEIQNVVSLLSSTEPVDLAHAELMQQLALRGADIITEYLGKIVKTVSYLETKCNSVKNKVALEYKDPDGSRTTAEMKKNAAESSPEVEEWLIKLAKAKGSKVVLEKKYDILIRQHHFAKEIAMGLKRTILGFTPPTTETVAKGWE